MFENRALRSIFGCKTDEVAREWRKVHKEELNDLYSSPNTVRVIKSRKSVGRGMWHAWERGQVHTGFWWGDLRERCYLEDPGVDGKIT